MSVNELHTQDSPRRFLNSLVANILLLSGIYFFVGNVFQQTYLRTLGVRVGVISQIIPNFTDSLVLIYAFILWLFLTRMPSRWQDRFGELVNLATHRNYGDTKYRVISIVLLVLLFYSVYIIPIALGWVNKPVFYWEYVIPPNAFLSSKSAAAVCVVVGLVLLAIYFHYARIRRQQLNEVTFYNRETMVFVLQSIVPVAVLYGALAFGYVFPANYGSIKADIDINRMQRTNLGRVEEMIIISEGCSHVGFKAHDDARHYIYTNEAVINGNPGQDLHYLGLYADRELFISFEHGSDTADNFKVCSLARGTVQSMQLSRPLSDH